MKYQVSFLLSLLFVLGSAASSHGTKFPFEKREVGSPRHGAHVRTIISLMGLNLLSSSDEEEEYTNEMGVIDDNRYTTNITLNGLNFHILLDTGSTDLWVDASDKMGKFNDSGIAVFMGYGNNSYGVNGTIGTAPFTIGPYTVENQAFLNAEGNTFPGLPEQGIQGVLGLGLNKLLASPIGYTIKKLEGPSATWGDSVLVNVFKQHRDMPSFIGFDLVRTEDMESSTGGSFTIGEYDEDYADIKDSPKLPIFPEESYHWTVVLNKILVNGKAIPLPNSSIPNAPAGSVVVALDTGAPVSTLPNLVINSIYSQFPGAVKYDGDEEGWIIPCNATPATVDFVFDGIKVSMHPLDLTMVVKDVEIMGAKHTFCVAYARGVDGDNYFGNRFDMLLGDSFLRNVYSVFDFGDHNANGTFDEPYVQLLPKTNMDYAKDQFLSIREHLSRHINELPPDEMVKILLEDSPTTPEKNSTTGPIIANVASTHLDNDDNTNDNVKKYAPIVLGLLGANLLVGVILIFLGILNYIRKGKPSRSITPAYFPVKFRDEEAPQIGSYENNTRYSQP